MREKPRARGSIEVIGAWDGQSMKETTITATNFKHGKN
jgi:hypothetical protein